MRHLPDSDPKLALLMVTSAYRYETLVPFALSLLTRNWPSHPPVFLAGATRDPGGVTVLPVKHDAKNWVGRVLDATQELLARGYERAYLVIEDHAPVARCHAEHLGIALPHLMEEHDLDCIMLQAWELKRTSQSRTLEFWSGEMRLLKRHGSWTPNPVTHPGLWRLSALATVCEACLRLTDDPSIWGFEAVVGQSKDPAIAIIRSRVGQASAQLSSPECVCLAVELLGLRRRDTTEHALKALATAVASCPFWRNVPWMRRFVEKHRVWFQPGPFPTYKSGLLVKGGWNRPLLRLLTRSGTPVPSKLHARFA